MPSRADCQHVLHEVLAVSGILTEEADGAAGDDRGQRTGLCEADDATACDKGREDEGGDCELLLV